MTALANTTTTLVVNGHKTQYMTGGSGPDLVYLHSAGGELDWTRFHNGLGQKFTVHAPAHPGFGMSDGLEDIDDIYDMAWHYVDLFEQRGWRQVPVVGFSLGAWLALEIAILRPELISKIVLVNAAGLHVAGAPMAELFIDDFDAAKNLLFYDPRSPVVAEAMPLSFDDPRILQWIKAREATARVGWSPYLHDPKLPRHLRRVTAPTLVLWGRQDKLIPQAHGEYYAQNLPDARLTVFEQCGHMLPYEQTDQFVQAVSEFLL